MTAQYKPYKDQEDFDEDQVEDNWGDADRGRVEIFDKSLAPRSKRKTIASGLLIAVVAIIIGILIGYFGHSRHSECKHTWSVALHSVMGADPTIRRRILEEVDAGEIKTVIGHATKTPRIAGFPESRAMTNYLKTQWEGYGLKTQISSYDVLLSYAQRGNPNEVKIMNADKDVFDATSVRLTGEETKQNREMDPIAAYSKSGVIRAQPLYGEYCFPNTLKRLQEIFRVDVKGKILICRQQTDNIIEEVVRGAELAGAAGIIFYIDPQDIGAITKQNSIPSDAVGMTNARYTPELYGDPLTPGFPSLNYTYRMKQEDVRLPNILVQPVSAADALEILRRMGGVQATRDWNGGFNITYHIGPGFKSSKLELMMAVNNIFKNATIDNVIGILKGDVEPDRYVIIGAHRDTWRYGAIDNAGGTAVLNELARVFGKLTKSGWRPRRTIIFGSWDANCFGRIGSNEWVEENLKLLKDRAIAYINIDSVVTGTDAMIGSGSALLMNAVFNATREVENPDTQSRHKNIYRQWLSYDSITRDIDTLLFNLYAVTRADNKSKNSGGAGLLEKLLTSATDPYIPRYAPINKISDWQPFMQKVGIPVVSLSYTGHSLNHTVHRYDTKYDNFEKLEKLDPEFKYHKAVAQVYGELLRNLADSLFIPFNLFDYAQFVYSGFIYQAINKREKWKQNGIDIDILESALKRFTDAALYFHVSQEMIILNNPMAIRKINDQLHLLEKTFTEVNILPKNLLKRALDIARGNVTQLHTIKNNAAILDVLSPGLSGLLSTLSYSPQDTDWDLFRLYYSLVVTTIQSASKSIGDNAF